VKFGVRVRTWYSLPAPNFVKNRLGGFVPQGKFVPKIWNFRDFSYLSPHFYTHNVKTLLKRTDGHCNVGVCISIISISMTPCLYVVPFLRYSSSKNGVPLKLGVRVVQGHWKWRRSIDHVRLSIGRPLYDYSCMLYHFQVIWRWIIMTLKRSLKVIQTGTIRKLGCGLLFAFHSNHGRIFNRLWDIQRQGIAWPWKLG